MVRFLLVYSFFSQAKNNKRENFVKEMVLLTLQAHFMARNKFQKNIQILGNVGQTIPICQTIFNDK